MYDLLYRVQDPGIIVGDTTRVRSLNEQQQQEKRLMSQRHTVEFTLGSSIRSSSEKSGLQRRDWSSVLLR